MSEVSNPKGIKFYTSRGDFERKTADCFKSQRDKILLWGGSVGVWVFRVSNPKGIKFYEIVDRRSAFLVLGFKSQRDKILHEAEKALHVTQWFQIPKG